MIRIEIPPKSAALARGRPVPLAKKGTSWSPKVLGPDADRHGVYVIHHDGRIKYVGKTDGTSMSFGMRLRREFQETASQGRHIFPKLSALKVPPEITACFFAADAIRGLVQADEIPFTDGQRIAIFEVAITQVYKPDFQA